MSDTRTPRRRNRHLGAVAAALALTASGAATATPASAAADLREVMFVGNNWEGTADVIQADKLRLSLTGAIQKALEGHQVNDVNVGGHVFHICPISKNGAVDSRGYFFIRYYSRGGGKDASMTTFFCNSRLQIRT